MPSDPTPEQLEDREFRERYQARMALFFYGQNRNVTNFAFFLASSEAEARPETVRVTPELGGRCTPGAELVPDSP